MVVDLFGYWGKFGAPLAMVLLKLPSHVSKYALEPKEVINMQHLLFLPLLPHGIDLFGIKRN